MGEWASGRVSGLGWIGLGLKKVEGKLLGRGRGGEGGGNKEKRERKKKINLRSPKSILQSPFLQHKNPNIRKPTNNKHHIRLHSENPDRHLLHMIQSPDGEQHRLLLLSLV